MGGGQLVASPLHELPCFSVLHQNQCCLWLHEGHLRLQRAGLAALPDLHCGPAYQEVPNPVPGGWKLGLGLEAEGVEARESVG